jgi:AbrB family looped-hinge helix DNA binding protein
MHSRVTLSSRYHVTIPAAACHALGLEAGDELLVLCKPDRMVMIPKPKSFTRRLAGLHRKVWSSASTYVTPEREAW